MAPFDQPVTSYSDTTPHKRQITDVISLIDPSDAPAVEALGGLDGASGKFNFINTPHTKREWLEDTLIPIALTMATASITSTTASGEVSDGSVLQPGHIIQIDDEQLWVSAVSANSVSFSRSFAGTTNASHASDDVVTVVGMARLEGDDSDTIGLTDRTTNFNYTQILHKELKVTRTHQQLAQYAIADEMGYQQDKAVPELMRLLERHLYYNTSLGAGSATTPRVMGGFEHFITDNTVAGAALAQADFENAVKATYEDGGSGPWFAFCSPTNYKRVKDFYDSSLYLRIDRTETTVGMVANQVLTPFGTVNLVLDRWAKDADIWVVDPENAGFETYYPFTFEPLAKDGDYEKAEVVGEFTLCVRQDKSHACINTITS